MNMIPYNHRNFKNWNRAGTKFNRYFEGWKTKSQSNHKMPEVILDWLERTYFHYGFQILLTRSPLTSCTQAHSRSSILLRKGFWFLNQTDLSTSCLYTEFREASKSL